MELSIIFPTYNAENDIVNVLDDYISFFPDAEFIIVCDGCTDNTSKIVNNYIGKSRRIRLVNLQVNIGKGAAIIEGVKMAKGDIIGFIDADDAFRANYIQQMIRILKKENIDGIIASKWKTKNFLTVDYVLYRKVLSRGWNYLVRFLFNLEFFDHQAGAKFFRKKAIQKINLNFICTGFDFDVELLYKMKKEGLKIKEIYVPTMHREKTTFRPICTLMMLKNIIRLRLRN